MASATPEYAVVSGKGFDRVRVKLLYFAWVRERIGKPAEEVEPPPGVPTIADLIGWLSKCGDEYAHAFENPGLIRPPTDRAHVKPSAPIALPRQTACFPP